MTTAYAATEDTPVVAAGVLANDTDVDGDALTAVLVSGPAHGSLTLNADGSFTYTPSANYNGPDSFTYKANDGQADSNVATVSHHRRRRSTTRRWPRTTATRRPRTRRSSARRAGQRHRRRRRRADRGAGQRPGPRHPDAQRRRLVHLHADRQLQRHRQLHLQGQRRQADSNVATVTHHRRRRSTTRRWRSDDASAATEDTPVERQACWPTTPTSTATPSTAILVSGPGARQPDAQRRRLASPTRRRRTTTAPTASPTRPTTARPTATSPPSRSTSPRQRRPGGRCRQDRHGGRGLGQHGPRHRRADRRRRRSPRHHRDRHSERQDRYGLSLRRRHRRRPTA